MASGRGPESLARRLPEARLTGNAPAKPKKALQIRREYPRLFPRPPARYFTICAVLLQGMIPLRLLRSVFPGPALTADPDVTVVEK